MVVYWKALPHTGTRAVFEVQRLMIKKTNPSMILIQFVGS